MMAFAPSHANSPRLRRGIFAWALRNAHRCLRAKSPGGAAQWALIAARAADRYGIGSLASGQLEDVLLAVARSLPIDREASKSVSNIGARWLHVLTESHTTGGHTALVRRWIELDHDQYQHSVVILGERAPRSAALSQSTLAHGGRVTCLGDIASLTERAARLRELASREADVVVIHSHMWDVVPTIAFGIPSSTPVLLLNHADHSFWVGASVADLVLNLRESGAEYSSRYRSIDRNVTLPIPLPDPPALRKESRANDTLRQALAIPSEATVLLTVGTEFKFSPIGTHNFIEAAQRIVAATGAYVVAVGPRPEAIAWAEAHASTGGHILAVGIQQDLLDYHEMADVYLEGFPFGSLTALLEAALRGVPCVRAPSSVEPPFASDGMSIANIQQPADVDAYVIQAVALAKDREARTALGMSLAESVRAVHCKSGWREHLAALRIRVPNSHLVYPFLDPRKVPEHIDVFWSTFLGHNHPDDPLAYALNEAAAKKLARVLDMRLWLACR